MLSEEEKCKTWLVTGSCGQDASYFFEILLEKGYTNIHGTMRRSATFNTSNIDHIFDKLKLHYADLTDPMNIHNIITKIFPDYVVNMAGQSHVAVSEELENYTIQVNTLGVLSILQSIRSLGLNKCRVYHCGTSEEFGNFTDGTTLLNEDSPKVPVSLYGVSKVAAENICNIYRDGYGMFVVCGTLFNHESPRRGGTFVTKKISDYVAKYSRDSSIKPLQLGALDSRRDWSHAKDMCEGIYKMITQKNPVNYILSSGVSYSVKDFAKIAFKEIGISLLFKGEGLEEKGYDKESGKIVIEVSSRYFRPIDIKTLIGDSSRARSELGWVPKISFQELVKEMVDFSLK